MLGSYFLMLVNMGKNELYMLFNLSLSKFKDINKQYNLKIQDSSSKAARNWILKSLDTCQSIENKWILILSLTTLNLSSYKKIEQ